MSLTIEHAVHIDPEVSGRAGAPGEPVASICVCGHGADQHEHYRLGDDCGTCGAAGCAGFRAATFRTAGDRAGHGLLRRLGASLRGARRPG